MKSRMFCSILVCLLTYSQGILAKSTSSIPGTTSRNQIETTATSPPYTTDVEVCADQTIPSLSVSGTNIKWYTSDAGPTLFDPRDGRTYRTVTIGGQVWMAENLNYGSRINGNVNSTNNGITEKYCLDNSESKCSTYGGLYQWDEMMNYSTVLGSQGICPTGWHIPSHDEMKQLEIELGMDPTQANEMELRGTTEGAELRTNGSSGFDALMAGKRELDGDLVNEGTYTTFWTSSQYYNRTLSIYYDQVYASNFDDKLFGFSVRCLKDSDGYIATGNTYYTGKTAPGTYTYYVTQTIDGVESERVPISLIIHPAIQVQITGNTQGCEGDLIQLDAGAGYAYYSWNTGSSTRFTSVTTGGSYSVTVRDIYNCTAFDQEQVVLNPAPQVSITGNTQGCDGESIELDAGPGFTGYTWSTAESTRTISVTGSGTYSVSVTDGNGCTNTDNISVTFSNCVQNYQPDFQDQMFNIDENPEQGNVIGNLIATDSDAGQFLTFSIISGNENSQFTLNPGTGLLTVNLPELMNYETNPQFILQAKVQDNGIGQLSDLATITVNVLDVNEAPQIENQSFSIDENAAKDATVGAVFVMDEDYGQSLGFEILFGNDNDAFKIDPSFGVLSVNNPDAIDYEVNPDFDLIIRVTDNAPAPLHDDATIKILLNDLNETSILNSFLSEYRIYPNPTNERIYIEFADHFDQDMIIDVYDSRGMLKKQLLPEALNRSSSGIIEIPFDTKGIHFIKIYSNGIWRMEKVICY